jgi:putative heme iron utilization protein
MTPGEAGRRFVRSQHFGVLSTLSQKFEGAPFGSLVDYITDQDGCPVILISALAEHTKNIESDPRVSLVVFTPGDNVQANPRLTLMGKAQHIGLDPAGHMRSRYLRYFPQAEQYLALDFSFHRIEIEQIRFIGGFGDVRWIDSSPFMAPANSLAEDEAGILNNINTQPEALQSLCQPRFGALPVKVELTGIDCDGFDVRADEKLLRFEFGIPVLSAQDIKDAIESMINQTDKDKS